MVTTTANPAQTPTIEDRLAALEKDIATVKQAVASQEVRLNNDFTLDNAAAAEVTKIKAKMAYHGMEVE